MNWILKLLGGSAAEKVGDYFIRKQELKNELRLTKLQGEINIATAKAQAKAEAARHVHNWEMASLANSGYKDEVVLGVLLIPYVGAFIPGVQDHILIGFQHLAQMPAWAVGLTVTIFLAIYGIRHRNASKIQAPGLRDKDVSRNADS